MPVYGSRRIAAVLVAVLCIIMLFVPATAVGGIRQPRASGRTDDGNTTIYGGESLRVLRSESGKVETVSRADYLFGAVAAEMGPDAQTEALKAQTVASYTFALFRSGENSGGNYDISDDPSVDQSYASRDEMREKWGDSYDMYAKKIDDAVAQAAGYVITDDSGAPILAAYHAVSSGRTESALVAWGTDYSYLQPAESIGDLLSPDYLSVRNFTEAELAEKLAGEVELAGDASVWIGDVSCSESATVKSITLGGVQVGGDTVRRLLGLRSAAFDASYADGIFTFNVKGSGHGVGMSQYGANYLAATGSTFAEILGHYYTGCKMVR